MGAKWDCEFSNENDVVVSNDNILADQRKEYKQLLDIKVFQVYVEVPIDHPPPKTKPLVDAAQGAAEVLQDQAIGQVNALAKEVADLQKEEKLGNKKAAETAQKLVEKVDKWLKNFADEFGKDIRKALQGELTGANKQKLRSTSRTMFRGVTLAEDAFDEDVFTEVPSFFKDIVKELAAAGTEAYKLATDETDNRIGLGQTVKGQLDAINKWIDDSVSKGGKGNVDLPVYVKENAKEINKLTQAKDKYLDFLKDFEDKLDKAIKSLDKLEQLSYKQQALKDNKEVSKEFDNFRSGAKEIVKAFDNKRKAAALVDSLFEKEWKAGQAFDLAQRLLDKQPDSKKSGKEMQDAGKVLEKLAEKMDQK